MANRPRSVALLAVTAAALAIRGLVVANLVDHPLLRPEGGLDSSVYVDLARQVAGGDLLLRSAPDPFFVSPLYFYFVALVLTVSGGALGAVLAVQALLGAAAVWMTGDAARRLFGDAAAPPAAILLALTGVVVFHESVLLQAALDPFLAALALWLVVRATPNDRARDYVLAGLAVGLFALNRPNVLPWAGVAALLVVAAHGLGKGSWLAGAMALGTLLGIAPVTLRNVVVAREPVLISSHGGLNFLVGNGPGADGTYRWLDGITPSIAGQSRDARKVAEKEAGRSLSTREVSAHFAAKAWSWIRSEPGAACRLFVRKIWYVLSGDEAPLNFSFPWYRKESLLLKLLAVGPWLLVPLGGAGLALGFAGAARVRPREFAVWGSFAPVYVLLVAAFFVATRYRLPLHVPLAAAGGGAVALVAAEIRARNLRRPLLAAAVALPLAVVTLWPTGLYDASAEEEAKWVLHLVDVGDPSARKRAEILSRQYPHPGVLWFRVGQAQASAGHLDEAIDSFERALAVDAHQAETERLLAEAHARRGIERTLAGDLGGARMDLEATVRLAPNDPRAKLNLAAVLADQGDRARARALANEALVLEPSYEKAQLLLRAIDRLK